MGTGAVNAAVADAGPLIHLAEVDSLALLRIFAGLHIPDAVCLEAVRPHRVQAVDLAELHNIRRHTIAIVDEMSLDHSLDFQWFLDTSVMLC